VGDLKILSYVRLLCGINLLVFQLFVLAPYFFEIYGTESYFSPNANDGFMQSYFSFSVLAYLNNIGRIIAFIIWIFCSFGLIFGLSNWLFWILIIFLNSQFHGLNPLIVHEPQQILNFLILILPFLNCTSFNIFELISLRREETEKSTLEVGLLTLLLGLYYFLAGVKKLPLQSWQTGSGFKEALSWNGIARPWLENIEPYFNELGVEIFLIFMNYSILVFEVSFLILAFTRFKRFLILVGFLFQILNFVMFDVGLFFLIMLSSYPVLLSKMSFLSFLKSLKDTFLLVREEKFRF
jgi:hypothetical protein